jgi:heme/copper-type cytochrome/quinol oxidase subunit 2
MKTLIRKFGMLFRSAGVGATLTLLFLAVQVFAQNAADSDLSNAAGTNKNWYGSMWFFGVVIALVIVIIIAFARRRKGSATDITNRQHRR